MGDVKDSQSRKWMITINNPLDKGFSHDKIKELTIRDRRNERKFYGTGSFPSIKL